MPEMTGRFSIEDVTPRVECGRYPAKAVVGELIPVSARVWREGHQALGVRVRWQSPDAGAPRVHRLHPGPAGRTGLHGRPGYHGQPGSDERDGDDRWYGQVRPDKIGGWTFTIEAFSDPYLTWRETTQRRLDAGVAESEFGNDLAEGALVLDRAAELVPPQNRPWVRSAAEALRDRHRPLRIRLAAGFAVAELLWEHPVRDLVTESEPYSIWVDRQRALFSAWYEFFPRSEGAEVDSAGRPVRHGTFASAADRLPAVAGMGFDVVYLPPIHPIGQVHRKGRDNAPQADRDDVGSPWAIGSSDGGHDAVHPRLGTLADFRGFVARAREVGLEVALDLALQCAPDHPWVSDHPEWFTTRPDGQIAYAENPPKKYQDIYPLNFDRDPEGIRAEILRVVRHWIQQGVKLFRVDNPHTKPPDFWHWLIWQVKQEDPEVLFLAEAFTRPVVMHGLAMLGFSQSYTYFTWRDTPAAMRDYCLGLIAAADYMRPNFWPTTPDILPESLQGAGAPMFKIRAVLASLLCPSWGVYAGYELCENVARSGTEEQAENEKYQLRPRDWAGAEAGGESLAPFVTTLNQIRRSHPALHWLRNLTFHSVDNNSLLCWSKHDPDSGDTVLVVCSFDPEHVQWGNTDLDLPGLGVSPDSRFWVRDELTGQRFEWGRHNPVRLDPHAEPAHVFTVETAGQRAVADRPAPVTEGEV